MNEHRRARRQRFWPRDRQMLTAAYSPVVAFAVVLIATRTSRARRHQMQEVLR